MPESTFFQELMSSIPSLDNQRFNELIQERDSDNNLVADLNSNIRIVTAGGAALTGTLLMHVLEFGNPAFTLERVQALLKIKDFRGQRVININLEVGNETALDRANRLLRQHPQFQEIIQELRNAGAITHGSYAQNTHASLANVTVAISLSKLKERYGDLFLHEIDKRFTEIKNTVALLRDQNPALKIRYQDVLRILQNYAGMNEILQHAEMTAKEAMIYIWEAIHDEKALTTEQEAELNKLEKDERVKELGEFIQNRFDAVMIEIASIAHTYKDRPDPAYQVACTHGTFNGIVSSLNTLHPDVKVYPFKADLMAIVSSHLKKWLSKMFAKQPLADQLLLLQAWSNIDCTHPWFKKTSEILLIKFTETFKSFLAQVDAMNPNLHDELSAEFESYCKPANLIQLNLEFPEKTVFEYLTHLAEGLQKVPKFQHVDYEARLFTPLEKTLSAHVDKMVDQFKLLLRGWFCIDHPDLWVRHFYSKLSLEKQNNLIAQLFERQALLFSLRNQQPISYPIWPLLAQELDDAKQKELLERIEPTVGTLDLPACKKLLTDWPAATKIILFNGFSREIKFSLFTQDGSLDNDELNAILSHADEAFRNQMFTYLCDRAKNFDEWLELRSNLPENLRGQFTKASATQLNTWLQTFEQLIPFIMIMTPEEEQFLLSTPTSTLTVNIDKYLLALCDYLKILGEEHRWACIERRVYQKILHFILSNNPIDNLIFLLNRISPLHYIQLLNKIGKEKFSMLFPKPDFLFLLSGISDFPKKSKQLFVEALDVDYLNTMFGNWYDLHTIFSNLTDPQTIQLLIRKIAARLINLEVPSNYSDDFPSLITKVISHLLPEDSWILLNKLSEEFLNVLILGRSDLSNEMELDHKLKAAAALVSLLSYIPSEHIEVFLKKIEYLPQITTGITSYLLKKMHSLRSLEHFESFIKVPYIQSLIQKDFFSSELMRECPSEWRLTFIESLEPLTGIVKNSAALYKILMQLAEDEQESLIARLENDHLVQIITTPDDLQLLILKAMPKRAVFPFVQRIINNLAHILNEENIFHIILSIDLQNRFEFIKTLRELDKEIVKTKEGFYQILAHLPPQHHEQLLKITPKEVLAGISTDDKIWETLGLLLKNRSVGVNSVFVSQLNSLLMNIDDDLRLVMLRSLCNTAENLNGWLQIYSTLDKKNILLFIMASQTNLLTWIQTFEQLMDLAKLSTHEEIELIQKNLGTALSNLVNDYYIKTQDYLKTRRKQERWNIIDKTIDLKTFELLLPRLEYLELFLPLISPVHYARLLNKVGRDNITIAAELFNLLEGVPFEHRSQLLDALGDEHLRRLVKNFTHFKLIFPNLFFEDQWFFLQKIYSNLSQLPIPVDYDLAMALKITALTPNQLWRLLNLLSEKHLKALDCNFFQLMGNIPAEHLEDLLKKLGDDFLAKLIPTLSVSVLRDIRKHVLFESFAILIDNPYIRTLIKRDFSIELLEELDRPSRLKFIFGAASPEIIIKDVGSLTEILHRLLSNHKALLLEKLTDAHLAKIITTSKMLVDILSTLPSDQAWPLTQRIIKDPTFTIDTSNLIKLFHLIDKKDHPAFLKTLSRQRRTIEANAFGRISDRLSTEGNWFLLELTPVKVLRQISPHTTGLRKIDKPWKPHYHRLLRFHVVKNHYISSWKSECSVKQNIENVFSPLASRFGRLSHGLFNTRGESYAKAILKELAYIQKWDRDAYSRLHDFLTDQLKNIDLHSKSATSYWGDHPTSTGETAMRIMLVREKLTELLRNEQELKPEHNNNQVLAIPGNL